HELRDSHRTRGTIVCQCSISHATQMPHDAGITIEKKIKVMCVFYTEMHAKYDLKLGARLRIINNKKFNAI
ncbi:hypothetical protein L9F63_014654, partial [Diploptera punctata]